MMKDYPFSSSEPPEPALGGQPSPSDMGQLWAAGAGAFDTPRPQGREGWQPPSLAVLQAALPQYEISAFIARGGMGAVYQGTQRTLKRAVAIKVLPPCMEDGDMQFAARFKQEAQAMAHLAHPNIVAVFDAGEVDLEESGAGAGTLLYFVMEFISGTDVARLIASEGRLEAERAVPIITAVCEALAFAHEEGIVHRDIKPSNVMIDHRGRVKVADFGLAKTTSFSSTLMTRTDLAMGTPDFMAPEVLVPGMQVDGRADLYAAGVMLYQMLTGHIPRGRFAPLCELVPEIGRSFDAVVDKALQTDRDKRYPTATQMKMAVQKAAYAKQAISGEQTKAESREQMPTRQGWSPRKKWTLGTAALLVAGAGAGFFLRQPVAADLQTPSRASPKQGIVKYPPYPQGEWVRIWQRPEDIPNAENATNGWVTLKPPLTSLHIPDGAGVNRGIRCRFRTQLGVPPPQLQLRDAAGFGYNVIPMYDSIRFRKNDPSYQTHNVEIGKAPLLLPRHGEEFTFEFLAIGARLYARLNDKAFTMSLDSKGLLQRPGDAAIYQVDRNAFCDVEFINLDGLEEREALRAAGADLSTATTVAASRVYSYPPGKWVCPFQEASDLDHSHTQRGITWKEGWITPERPSNPVISLTALNVAGQNWGVRARYRWQENAEAVLYLRRMQSPDKAFIGYDLRVNAKEASFRQSLERRDGTMANAQPIGKPMLVGLSAGDEVLVEAFAIGGTLYGRVNGAVFKATTDNPLKDGSIFAGSRSMSYRDIEFINLDGLSEADAKKAAGLVE